MTQDYIRTVEAPDSVTAQDVVKVLAVADGYVVRTVKSVRLAGSGVFPSTGMVFLPRYTVTLAVVAKPSPLEVGCD